MMSFIRSAKAQKNLQFQLGDVISIFSEKAYRKNEGNYFEAVGNVVIKSAKETLYGEKASLDLETGSADIEGNVRYVGDGLTIYGPRMHYDSKTSLFELSHARVITEDFHLSAELIQRKSDRDFYAKKAIFSTCKDCSESWSIAGDEIYLELGQYVRIHSAYIKVKGINVVYIPYIILPVKNKRETGLLFPTIFSRFNEGLGVEQPFFWAISESQDATITPLFYARRGYGSDLEYRQEFGESKWLEFQHKIVDDQIYLPGKSGLEKSNEHYFRHFYNLQAHSSFSHETQAHLRVQGLKDLDFSRDYTDFSNQYLRSSDVGANFYLENRNSLFEIGAETNRVKNLLYSDPEGEDEAYVQTSPTVYFGLRPLQVFQSDRTFFHRMVFNLNSEFTQFRPLIESRQLDPNQIRRADRTDVNPSLKLNWLNTGSFTGTTKAELSYQNYFLPLEDEKKYFYKSATIYTTEFSFYLDKIFGVAYQREIPVERIESQKKHDQEKKERDSLLVGSLPDFESSLTQDKVKMAKESYRHTQQVRLLHYYTSDSTQRGNADFKNQISSFEGQFDYRDTIIEEIAQTGALQNQTEISKENTLELQLNNRLISKTSKGHNAFEDNRFLRDNFSYSEIGRFLVSQGIELNDEAAHDSDDDKRTFRERLTRLRSEIGWNVKTWNFKLTDYYFHINEDHIYDVSLTKNFSSALITIGHIKNQVANPEIQQVKFGTQLLPWDTFGLSFYQEYDLEAKQNLQTIYQVDLMPANNCWIFNLNFRNNVNETRYAFNFIFNFGDNSFKDYRKSFFDFDRIK